MTMHNPAHPGENFKKLADWIQARINYLQM